MEHFLEDKSEKKVRYIELIYDLIFVYLVSKNVALLEVESGFITFGTFLTYLASTLAILQIWYMSTMFINRYGDGSLPEYIGLFVNMYLLYHMANGIRTDWGPYYYRFNSAWMLILINMAAQYFILLRKTDGAAVWTVRHIKAHMTVLLIEAGIVLVTMPIYYLTGMAFAPWAMVFGFVSTIFTRQADALTPADFPHLSERVMLYVVFTFGEMILGITGYFDSGLSFSSVYFSLLTFLIVAGLFSGYGYFYEHLLDHEVSTTGTRYMLLHIVMVLALNNITVSLEFMRDADVSSVPKNILLVASILVYFLGLLFTQRYAVAKVVDRSLYVRIAGCFAAYCAAIALCYRTAEVSIAVTVVFIYMQLFALHKAKAS